MNDNRYLLVYMTARTEEEAARVAEALVSRGLAAGVNMIPGATSVYRWKGEVCRHTETLLFAQTTEDRFAELDAAVRELHSYETPCVLAAPVSRVSEAFGRWITDMTTTPYPKR